MEDIIHYAVNFLNENKTALLTTKEFFYSLVGGDLLTDMRYCIVCFKKPSSYGPVKKKK